MRANEVVITDRIRIPRDLMIKKQMYSRYNVELFEDSKCMKCENLPNRHPENELCEECPAFKGAYRFFSTQELKEKKIWSLPQADEVAIRQNLLKRGIDFKWTDKRKIHEAEHKLKFKGRLYTSADLDDWGNPRPDQEYAVEQWMRTKIGVIQAPPRSGKTQIATSIYCQMRMKTVVVANQKELLNQFYETACGVPAPRMLRNKMVPSNMKAGRTKSTNIPFLQEKYGKQIIFMPKNYAQLLSFIKSTGEVPDVLLVTYQSFARDMKRVAKVLNKHYSFVIIDEQHGAGADKYLRFVAGLNMKYRLGLSATPDRKDMRSDLVKLVYGPVVSVIRTTTLRPKIVFKSSAAYPKTSYVKWTAAFRWLTSTPERNIEIVKEVFKDLRAGHNTIIVPVDYKSQMNALVKMINHQAGVNSKKKDENWPEVLARAYHSGIKDRMKVLQWADREKGPKVHKDLPTKSPRVLVAIRSMVKQGIDLARPSMIYIVMPMSAKAQVGAPMFRQLSMRVATPYTGKPAPVCKVWMDNVKMFASCTSGLLYNEILPRSNLNTKEKNPQYILEGHDYDIAKDTLKLIIATNGGKNKMKQEATNGGYW